MSKTPYLIVALLLFLIGCKEEPRKKLPPIQQVDNPAGEGSSLPFLFANDHTTYMSWVSPVSDSLMALNYSSFEIDQWSAQTEIIKDTDWFVNWADFPLIVENKGSILTHVLKKSTSGTYSYDVKLNLKPKAGPWKTNLTLHSDNTPTEHGFVTALPYDDHFFITWLDGRHTMENTEGERGAMTIRAAEVSLDGNIGNEIELDAKTCDCCQTTAAITDNGPVVIYRDRSDDEVRDISIVRRVAGEWTAPKSVHNDAWQIKGCPVNGPKATALGNDLVIAWFTAANGAPKVNLIFSGDGGATFDAPIRVDEANAIGRVDLLLLNENQAVVSWMETKDGQAVLKALKVDRSGKMGKAHVITTIDASRQSGFPQMEQVGKKILFAWTHIDDRGDKTIKTAMVGAGQF